MTRGVSPALARCELQNLPRVPMDVGRAEEQHSHFEQALRDLGCEVVRLPADPALPDCVFIEDTALVLDEVAVVLRPGAASRRAETPAVAAALASYRDLIVIGDPGTADGGDVLRVGRKLYVGCSTRSNAVGIGQLAHAVAPYGYHVVPVPFTGCLHLKSAVTRIGPDALLVNRGWIDPAPLGAVRVVEVDPAEPHAANALWLGDTVVHPAAFPRTRERIEAAGARVVAVDVSELQKAEGAVTCCCLVFEVPGG